MSAATKMVPIVVATLLVVACESLDHQAIDSALVSVGLADPAPLHEVTIDVLIDGTPGAAGASLPASVEEVQHAARAIADRPGSLLRVWTLATATDEARVVYETTVPTRSTHAWRSTSDDTFENDVAARVGPALEPELAAAAEARLSPIASSIDRILLTDAVGDRVIVLVTDGRERAEGRNAECADVSTRSFRASLDRSELLRPASISGAVRIEFAGFAMLPLRGRGCRATVRRERAIRAMWTEVLTEAGATSVAFRSGHAELGLDAHVAQTTEE